MTDAKARRHAFFFTRGKIGFAHAALGAFFDEFVNLGVVFSQALGKRVFGGNGHECHTHQRVGASGKDLQFLFFAVNGVGEGDLHTDRLADPVFLHAAHLFRPAFEDFQIFQEFIGVLRDAQVVARDFTLFDNGAGTPAASVDHLFVGEHRFINRVPVNDLSFAIADALFQHFQEHPLVPAIVFRRAGGNFTRPVKREAKRLHLIFHFSDVVKRPLGGSDAMVNGGVFRRKAESVPTHRRHHVVALHAKVAVHHVI